MADDMGPFLEYLEILRTTPDKAAATQEIYNLLAQLKTHTEQVRQFACHVVALNGLKLQKLMGVLEEFSWT